MTNIMATIATCPRCASQLALPETASHVDRVQCPQCEANFLLADAAQTLLPSARILDAVEPLSVASMPSFETPTLDIANHDVQSDVLVDTAVERSPQLDKSPEFDFELDPPPSENPAEDQGEPTATEFAIPALDDVPEISLRTSLARRSRRGAATWLVGSSAGLVGILLGFYALMWLRGLNADYLHLAQYLPDAMLPVSMKLSLREDPASILAEAKPQLNDPSALQPVEDLVVDDNTINHQAPRTSTPELPIRDTAVIPASHEKTNLPSGEIGITPEEFGRLFAATSEAVPGILEGDLSTHESIARKGHAYMALCRLAEHFEFVHQPGLDPGVQTQIALAKDLFHIVTTEAQTRHDLAQIAARWWEYDGRPNQGIFLAGRIQDVQTVGTQALCTVVLDDQEAASPPIPVLLDRLPYSVGDQIGVVGRVITQPRDQIQGYDGEARQIVVAQYSYNLDDEPAPDAKLR